MVTGDAHVTITNVGSNVKETCAVIWNVLCDKGYVSPPSWKEAWKNVSAGCEQRWNFPNALCAIDGKYVIIQAPPDSSSLYFNYKKRSVLYSWQFVTQSINSPWQTLGRLGGRVMAMSTQTVTWAMLLKMVSSTYHSLLSFQCLKGYFHMLVPYLVWKTTWRNHTRSNIYLLQRESIELQVITSTKSHWKCLWGCC